MASPHEDSYDSHTRKRVGKACDRCRLKKSKCDGANPCSRCKADNSICVFGERKKSQDKIYPKGYVEMLEQQQCQLVAGVREMYKKLLAGEQWPGEPLHNLNEGQPLTHDILERLDVLHITGDNPVKSTSFDDNFSAMQERLLQGGAPYVRHRRGSTSSDSDPGLSHSESPHSTPVSRSLSSFSNASSRKRSSPATPTLTKTNRAHHSGKKRPHHIHASEVEPAQLWREPWVMQTTEMTEPLDANLFDNSYNAAALGSMYNPLSVNPLTAPSLNTMAQTSIGNWAYQQDPEFDSFVRSGYHGPLA